MKNLEKDNSLNRYWYKFVQNIASLGVGATSLSCDRRIMGEY